MIQDLNFSERWDKIRDIHVGQKAHTVRWNDKYDYFSTLVGQERGISLNKKRLGTIRIEKVELTTVLELSTEFIQEDTYKHWTEFEFLNLLRRFYGKKENWHENGSQVCIIYYTVLSINGWGAGFLMKDSYMICNLLEWM